MVHHRLAEVFDEWDQNDNAVDPAEKALGTATCVCPNEDGTGREIEHWMTIFRFEINVNDIFICKLLTWGRS